jgi:hypothetical protein
MWIAPRRNHVDRAKHYRAEMELGYGWHPLNFEWLNTNAQTDSTPSSFDGLVSTSNVVLPSIENEHRGLITVATTEPIWWCVEHSTASQSELNSSNDDTCIVG